MPHKTNSTRKTPPRCRALRATPLLKARLVETVKRSRKRRRQTSNSLRRLLLSLDCKTKATRPGSTLR